MHEVSCLDHMKAQMNALAQKVESLTINPTTTIIGVQPKCEICRTQGHITAKYNLLAESNPDQVNYSQGNPYFKHL